MANYPKTRKIEKPVKMADGKWKRTTNSLHIKHNTIKYKRWYGNNIIALHNDRGSDIYSYSTLRERDWTPLYGKFRAKSLKEAQDHVDLMIEKGEFD